MSKSYSPYVVSGATRCLLGECPVWDDRTSTLFWVDIERGALHYCQADGSDQQAVSIGERIGCIALRQTGEGLVAGLEHSIALLTLDPISIQTLALQETHTPNNRSNDGKCDPKGRFWVGSCDMSDTQTTGWLYRFDERGSTRMLGPFICVNGPAFSPDGETMYCVDSYARVVYSCRMSACGDLIEKGVLTTFQDPALGYPDGLTCDVEGCVWVAHWGGSRVSRFSPRGELLQVIHLPVIQPTSCTFGGEDLRTLFITSASMGLDPSADPEGLAGAVLAVHLDVGGEPAARFAG